MSELSQLRGLYTIGNIEDWSGQTEYEIAEMLGRALDIADQQAARIAELEAALDKIWSAVLVNVLPQAAKFDVEQVLRELGYGDGER